jgi:hypothetical protein
MSGEEVFKPNEKELKLFEQEKLELYKGTFVVCLVYGITAFLLLIIILFTNWGKEYIYDKFAPAVITFIGGSIIIIISLISSIYNIKPRKIGKDIESDNNIMCPEYWKLEKVPEPIKEEIIINNNNYGSQIIPEINSDRNANIQYRCVYDKNVYGKTDDYLKMNNDISKIKYYPGFNTSNLAVKSITNKNAKITPDYIVSLPDKTTQTFKELKKYAKFSGAYSVNNSNIFNDSNYNVLKVGDKSYLSTTGSDKGTVLQNYENNAPLICNIVYPQVLGVLDSKTKSGNEVSCEYAKQCGISWSSLNCK